MAVIENRFACDLSKPVQAQALKGNVFSLDNLGSRLSVLIYDNGVPATISGSVTANCILQDGSTVNINGSLTTENGGSKAYVDVPQSCLLIPGLLKIAIKCTSSSVITTLAAIVANVYMTKTDNVITPSQQIIDDWNAEISAAIGTQDAKILAIETEIGNTTLPTTAQTLTGAIAELDGDISTEASTRANADTAINNKIGNTPLPTTAQTITGAIAEHETDISRIDSKIGNTALPTTAQTLTGAIAEHEEDLTNQQGQITDLKSALAIGDHIINGDTVEVTKNVPGTSGTGMNTFTNIILLKGIEYTFVSEGTSLNNVCSSTIKGQDGTTLATIGDINGTTSKTKKYTPAEDIAVTVNHYCYATSGSIKDTITANVTVKSLDDEIEAVEAEKAEMPFAMSEFAVSAGTNHSSADDQVHIFIKTGQKYIVKVWTNISAGNRALRAYYSDGTDGSISYSGTASKDIVRIGLYAANNVSSAVDQYVSMFVAKNPIGADLIESFEKDPSTLHQIENEFRYVSYGKNMIGNEAGRLYPIVPIKSGDKVTISTGNGTATDQTYTFTFYAADLTVLAQPTFGTATGTSRVLNTTGSYSVIVGTRYISIDKVATYPFQIEIGDTKTAYQEYRPNALVWQEEIEKTKYELSDLPFVEKEIQIAANTSHSSHADRLNVNILAGNRYEIIVNSDVVPVGSRALYFIYTDGTDEAISATTFNAKKSIHTGIASKNVKQVGIYAASVSTAGYIDILVAKNPAGADLIESIKMAVPEYYMSSLATVKGDIIAHTGAAGRNGTSFVFATDLHWGSNVQNSPQLVNYIVQNTPVNRIVLGGDYITQYANKTNAVNSLNDCMDAFKGLSPYVFPIFGNHDRNSNQHEGSQYYLSKAETYAIINSWMNPCAIYGPDYFNFYFDDNKSKTRHICLYSGAQLIDEKSIPQEAIDWAEAKINELSSDWHVVVFVHWVFEYSGSGDIIVDGHLNGSYNPDALTLFAMLDGINSATGKAKVEGIVVGHLHVDFIDETTGGIPIVFTDCDGYGGTKGTTGTITEQCFDVITFDYSTPAIYCDRVGRGSSRVWPST